jgi:D-3-phosphoglycerate dehydrogenase
VAGALLSRGHPRLVRIQDYRVDVNPRGTILVIRNRDVPGVIGRVGTLLGEAGVNIGEYHQARLVTQGEAMAAVTVDGTVSAPLIAALRSVKDIVDVRQVMLDGTG